MPARKNPRLVLSEYYVPDSSIAVQEARRILMESARRVFPKMLERLAADVLPVYEEPARSGFNLEAVLWHSGLSPFKELPQESSLRFELSKWASEFHAEQGWFLDDTLRTLRGWHIAPDWLSELKWNPIGGVTTAVAWGEPFKLDYMGWEMQLHTWADYSQSVRERFEQHLAEYEVASRMLAESRGLVRAPHKYSLKNLEWFVLYQFKGQTAAKIAGRDGVSAKGENESTILKGVKAAARLIGWDSLRPKTGPLNRKIR